MAAKKGLDDLLARFAGGDRLALSRIMSHAENATPDFPYLFDSLYPRAGNALRVGVTGPPGAGKSTLVEAIARVCRGADEQVGVIAVDPTSPFSGGALLGDRIRMQRLALDPDVFVRSMASRGSVGGLAHSTDEVADVMDAFGFATVLIETVGVGQSEVDVASSAATTIVVLFPGAGDMIQAMKAGLMEIADIFVINKADLPGADRVEVEVGDMLQLRKEGSGWRPPILKCSARNEEGIEEVWKAVEEHVAHIRRTGEYEERRRNHVRNKVRRMVAAMVEEEVWQGRGQAAALDAILEKDRALSPFRLAGKIVANVFNEDKHS